MAGVSVSHLIIFVASLMIAGAVVGAAFTGVDQFNSAMEDRSVTAAENLRTDVSIISDPASSAIYDDENVTILLKNTGELDLTTDERQLDVLFNGEYVPADQLHTQTLEDNDATWRTGDVMELNVEQTDLEPGDYRVTVLVNGDEEMLDFRVTEDEA